jgi:hypothetical protein
MYWIYIIIFILAVLTPEIVANDFGVIDQERIEELILFSLGVVTFLIVLLKERQLSKSRSEKTEFQREASRIFRDLKDTYSYIGEINRKLEILKNIALGLPENSLLTPTKEKEIYDSIIEAVRTLVKTSDFSIRFINTNTNNVEKEIKGRKNFYAGVRNNLLANAENACVSERDKYMLICSPRSIDNISAWIIIAKKKNQISENIEILKALASQSLFLFAFSRKAMLNKTPITLD